jgi:signal transduction histidine kinase/DNA-binding NarL/FixJ family response regulator
MKHTEEKTQEAFVPSVSSAAAQAEALLESAHSLYEIGQAHYVQNEFEFAAQHLSEALSRIQQFPQTSQKSVLVLTVKCLKSLGTVHYLLGNFSAALDFLMRADSLCEFVAPTPKEQIELGNKIAAVQSALGDYESAIAMLERSLGISRQAALRPAEAITLNNLGNVLYRMKQYDLALARYQESLEIRLVQAVPTEIAVARYGIGNVLFEKGEFEGAKCDYEACMHIVDQTNDQKLKAHILEALGRLYLHFSFSGYNPNRAIAYFNEALTIAESLQFKRLIYLTLEQLAVSFERIGDFQTALRHERRSREIKDEVVGEEQQKATRALTVLHQTEQAKKDAELERLKSIELADALKKVEEANAFKTELLGIAAHDLKNPLQVISGFSSLIEEAESLDEAKRHATLIQSSSARMLKLVRDLLETASLDSGKLELSKVPVNLAELLRAVAEHNRPNAEKKSQAIELKLEEGCVVELDEERMREVFENLVSNAVKYSPVGKRIQVRLVRSSEEVVRIEVKDEGQGLTEADKEKLFGKFQRLSARPTGGESSTGLGLAIVKQLVELHGGKVWAESDGKGKGATFCVELPVEPSADVQASGEMPNGVFNDVSNDASNDVESELRAEKPKSKHAAEPIRIALVEDNLELLEELARQLSHDWRFRLVGKYDSAELALGLLDEVDVVLMDIGLPGISGIEAIQEIKARFPNAKIVMLTVQEDDKHISRAIIAGAHGYLTKKSTIPKILDAALDAFQSGMPMSPSVAKRVSDFYVKYAPKENPDVVLSEREKGILEEIIKGGTVEQIAKRLFISSDTVRNHLRRIYDKMHVHSRSEAIALALKQGLI